MVSVHIRWATGIGPVVLLLMVSPAMGGSVYYVAPAGDDLNPGSIGAPWATIQHAADTLGPGDVVYLRSGTYNEHVGIATSGTPGASIDYTAHPGESPVIDGTGVEGYTNGVVVTGSYIRLTGLEIRNWEGNGIWAEGAGFLEITNCTLHHLGYGIGVADGTHDFTITGTEIHHFDYYGFDASPSGGSDCYNGFLVDCIAHDWNDPLRGYENDGFALSHEGDQHTFELTGCRAYNVGDGFDIGGRNATLSRCSAHDAEVGFKVWGDGVTIENCLSYRNEASNLELDWDGVAGTTTVRNCDLVDAGTFSIWVENPGDTLHLYNTICAGGDALGLTFEGGTGSYEGDYNLFQNNQADRAIVVAYTDEFSQEQIVSGAWTAYSAQDAHSVTADSTGSIFADPAGDDFRLAAGSPAIGAGSALYAPDDDYEGTRRSGAIDIGAYAYGDLIGRYMDPATGRVEKEGAVQAVNDYLFNGTLSRADAVSVVNAYLFG